MANYGFVYIMTNPSMKAFKLGCTERSPHLRADELSSSTGIPEPFEVLCYAEFHDFQKVERELHEFLADDRVSENREFFYEGCLREAVARMAWHELLLAFTATPLLLPYFREKDGDARPRSVREIFSPCVDYLELPPNTAPRRGFGFAPRLVA